MSLSADQVRGRIAAIQALTRTHKCVIHYESGLRHEVLAISERAAQNHAIMVRRNIGRDLIDRVTGLTVRIVSVSVEKA